MEALICDEAGQPVMDPCEGALWNGGCPRTKPGLPVACSGRNLVVSGVAGTRVVLAIEPGATSCPLAAFDVYSTSSARSCSSDLP